MGVGRGVVVAVRRHHTASFSAIVLAMTVSGLLAAKGRERRLDLAARLGEQPGLVG
jgi:hypothetical protein